jgi:superfamily I DNA/RNA helicase
MPLADIRAFLAHAAETGKTPLAALADAKKLDGISQAGKDTLARLNSDLDDVGFNTTPAQFLRSALFECGWARHYLVGDAATDQQRRLAIHQFLQFAIEYDGQGEVDPKRRLLGWIRRLEIFGDERALREPPAAVDGIDAVRLMTVHASKGSEFDTVHLPTLGKGIDGRGERSCRRGRMSLLCGDIACPR